MQRLFITALACLLCFSVFGQANNGPVLSIDKTIHDYGVIAQGSNGTCVFTVTNKGTTPLVLSRCKGSCGCLVPVCDKDPIMPGATSFISIKYDTKRIGPINKSVTITSNALNEPTKVIRVMGQTVIAGSNQLNIDRATITANAPSDNIRIRVSGNRVDISKVAVIGKKSTLCDGTKDDGQGLAELVEGELLGLYGVVERKYLEEILDEQRLAMSGLLFEDTDFATAGCLAGAQGTVLASYGCLQGKTKLQVKLVDCSTSDLYWSATGLDVSEFDLLDALRSKLK